MSFTVAGRTISKIGVIGSGQIGPDIALFFSKALYKAGVPVVVVDVAQEALNKGQAKTKKKIDKGVETKSFKPDEAESIFRNIVFTSDYSQLKGADLVIEAATENVSIKQNIVAQLEDLCPATAILASNSSHMEPEVIFANAKNPARALVIHYFFPAERNPLVEVVPGKATAGETASFCMKFYEAIGKVPIKVKSRYGYAIDPIFEGIFQVAAHCVENELASPKVVDAIACKCLGLGVGPFTAMNLTGGNPITQHGLNEMHEKIMPWFGSPEILDEQMKTGKPWESAGRGENIAYDKKTYDRVSFHLVAAYFGLATEILDSGISNIGDLEMGLEIGLVVRPPFAMMNEMGVGEAYETVKSFAERHEGFCVPKVLADQAKLGKPWDIPTLFREDVDGIALLTIKRPRVLNALNRELFVRIKDEFSRIKNDKSIRGVVLTGFGVKAFVSGADIGMLSAIKSPAEGEALSKESHEALVAVENVGKPVVCAMNGLAFGGGNELAMACTARIARKGISVLAAQPEPKLGIIPGAGATQRLPRIIGIENAWELLRTGKSISSKEAKSLGLIHEEVEGDLVDCALRLANHIAEGKVKVRPIPKGAMDVPEKLPSVDIGNLSRKIDSIMQEAILRGAAMPLSDALRLESQLFGECCKTKDMKIGLENFLKTSLKEEAKFIHE